MRKFILSALLGAILLAQPAMAAIDDKGAAEVKRLVDASLAYQKQIATLTDEGFRLTGDVTVTPKKDFYEIRLPGAAVINPNGRIELGTVIINATPGKDGEYLTSMAVPQTLRLLDKDGSPVFEVKIGKQRFAGAWWPALRGFTRVDAEYGDIVVKDLKDGEASAKIGGVNILMKLTENADKTWSGPTEGVLKDLTLSVKAKDGNGSIELSVEKMAATAIYDGFNIIAARNIEDKVLAVFEANKGKDATPEQMKRLIADIMKDIVVFMNGQKSAFNMTNLSLSMVPKKKGDITPAPLSFKMGKFSSSFEANGLQQEKGTASTKVSFDGLVYPDVPSDFKGVVPTSSNFDVTFDNLPMKAMTKMFGEIIVAALDASLQEEAAQGGAPNPKAQTEVTRSLMTLPGLLASAGAKITIRDTYTKSPDLVTSLGGSFTAQPSALSMIPIAGSMTLTMQGLDELIQKFQTIGSVKTVQYADMLAMAQMMGQLSKAADGRSLRTYKLDVTPEGKILLNGADLQGMGALMGINPGMAPKTP